MDSIGPVTSTLRDTPLRAVHERLGATMTDFAGWLMPLRYGGETAEHDAVRNSAALFDLSHMGEIAVTGPDAAAALDYAVCGWPSRLPVGGARYTMLCAPDGGILDDLIVYRQADDRFLVVANAVNTAVVLGELRERSADFGAAVVTDETLSTGLISVQGPNGPGLLSAVTDLPVGEMRYYSGAYGSVAGVRPGWRGPVTPARTASRSSARPPTASGSGTRSRRRRRAAGRPGGARYAAPGGRDAAVRQRARPGRDPLRGGARPGGQAGQAG